MYGIVWNALCPPGYTQGQVVEKILDPSFPVKMSDLVGKNPTARTRFFTGNPSSSSFEKYADLMLAQTTDPVSHRVYPFGSVPFWTALRDRWAEVLQSLTPEQCASFDQQLEVLLTRWTWVPASPLDLYELWAQLSVLTAPERLATLSAMASTWRLWLKCGKEEHYLEKITHLQLLIFPTPVLRDAQQAEQGTTPSAQTVQEEDEARAQQGLAQARRLVDWQEYREAGRICEELLSTCCFASDTAKGQAFYLLGCCCQTELGAYAIPTPYTTVEQLFRQASLYGYTHSDTHSHAMAHIPKRAADTQAGQCVVNGENAQAAYLKETIPDSWSFTVSEEPASLLRPHTRQRFVLLSDDLERNTRDALKLLAAIQARPDPPQVWRNTALYIRCREERVSQLLDTALHLMQDPERDMPCPIPIFLLDEAKRSAQMLLTLHPLFYPLTFSRNKARKKLRLVLVTSNPETDLACWLVREAFWLLPRTNGDLSTELTVLSPQASGIASKLLSLCPGLGQFTTVNGKAPLRACDIAIHDIPFTALSFVDTAFDTSALSYELDKLEDADSLIYYVVDGETDLDSISLAVRVREDNIRRAVLRGRITGYAGSRPVIACRCEDPNCALLARHLLVPKEEKRRNQWFNNYGFFPFGSRAECWSWEGLDSGIVEQVSQCIHLQYCGAAPHGTDYLELASYFSRLYPRDSSFASAMSLPYRLFEAGIVPPAWYIQDDEAFWGQVQREELASRFEAALDASRSGADEELVLRLAKYEHTRWCCYMLSRGWLPTSDFDQVIQYMKAGAARHSLQIAKLHPCICSWEDLKELQRVLDLAYCKRGETGKKETIIERDGVGYVLDERFAAYRKRGEAFDYFTSMDFSNIEMTPALLRTAWFCSEKEKESP